MSVVDVLTDAFFGGKSSTRDRELRKKVAEIRLSKRRIERTIERLADEDRDKCRVLQRTAPRAHNPKDVYAIAREIKLIRQQKEQFQMAARQMGLLQRRLQITENQNTIQRTVAEAADILKDLGVSETGGGAASSTRSMREFSRQMQQSEARNDMVNDALDLAFDEDEDGDDFSLQAILEENNVSVPDDSLGSAAFSDGGGALRPGAAASSRGGTPVLAGAGSTPSASVGGSGVERAGLRSRRPIAAEDDSYSMQLLQQRLKNLREYR